MILLRTASGKTIDLQFPAIETIDVRDIACGLSKCCRFAGQIPRHYSVAQHSLLVSQLVLPSLAYEAQHHDDTEAYMGDLSRHLKHHPLLAGYREIEKRLNQTIEQALGITLNDWARAHIKVADDLAAIYEHVTIRLGQRFDLCRDVTWAIDSGFVRSPSGPLIEMSKRLPEFPRLFYCMSAPEAEAAFLAADLSAQFSRRVKSERCFSGT